MIRLSLSNIEEASRVIDPVFRESPQCVFDSLSDELGVELIIKIETINPIRNFKGRGADYYVQRLDTRGSLVTASAGNFGQGMAWACRKRGIPIRIFAAKTANPLKLDRMRRLGAEVVLAGHDFDAAKAAARAYADSKALRFVEDSREPAITEGAGTIAVELLRGPWRFDSILVPLGNGALINGIGAWMKAHAPHVRVIGVCAAGAPSMERSWRSGRIEVTPTADTIADGIAVRVPVPESLEDMRYTTDEILLVDDQRIVQAMQLIEDHTGLIAEPSGAVGIAAIRQHALKGTIATILCGSNVLPKSQSR